MKSTASKPESEASDATGVASIRIARLPIHRINAAPYNPRKQLKPGDPEWKKLERSIDAFGYVDPLVWNERTGNLVGGHQRLAVMLHKGNVAEVDVSVVDLPESHEKALNVALNRIAGAWDESSLKSLLAEIEDADLIDTTLTGFDEKEIDELLRAATESAETPDTSPQLSGLAFRVVVDCRDETHQRELLERFEGEGLTCRALIS